MKDSVKLLVVFLLLLDICFISSLNIQMASGDVIVSNFDIKYHLRIDGFLYKSNQCLVYYPSGVGMVCDGEIEINVRDDSITFTYILRDVYEDPSIYYFNDVFTFDLVSTRLYYSNGTFFGRSPFILNDLDYEMGENYPVGEIGSKDFYYYYGGESTTQFSNNKYIKTVDFHNSEVLTPMKYFKDFLVLYRSFKSHWDPFFEQKYPDYDTTMNSNITMIETTLPVNYVRKPWDLFDTVFWTP
ncbi:MAG: hypothetical protein ACTSUE_21105 [Promethearchaeota archaeon]